MKGREPKRRGKGFSPKEGGKAKEKIWKEIIISQTNNAKQPFVINKKAS